jgi:hypothetical protein
VVDLRRTVKVEEIDFGKILNEVDARIRGCIEALEKAKEERKCYCPTCYDVERRGSERYSCICGGKYVTIDDAYVEAWKRVLLPYGEVVKEVVDVYRECARGEWRDVWMLEPFPFTMDFGVRSRQDRLRVFFTRPPKLIVELGLHDVRNPKPLKGLIPGLRKIVDELRLKSSDGPFFLKVFVDRFMEVKRKEVVLKIMSECSLLRTSMDIMWPCLDDVYCYWPSVPKPAWSWSWW